MAQAPEPDTIHPDRLTAKGEVFQGTVHPADLEALDDLVEEDDGELVYRVEARLDQQQRRIVSCRIEGFVMLACQSTGERFRHPVSIDDQLILVPTESDLPPFEAEGDEADYVVADGPMPVQDLIQEAVVLALPMVPRKPGAPRKPVEAAKPDKAPSPFAALAGLKGRKK